MSGQPHVRRSLGYLMQDASRLMRRHFVQLARETGLPLNRSEAIVLLYVWHDPGLNQASLASALDIEPISLVRLVDRLQAAGLIERRRHPGDRRARTLWLTEAAPPVIAQIRGITRRIREKALAGIPAAHQEQLLDLLLTVRNNLAPAREASELSPEEAEAVQG